MDESAKYKVPFRQVYCLTIRSWIRETIWCHVVNRLFRYDIESIMCKCGSYGTPK
jgi:hypothetical protein